MAPLLEFSDLRTEIRLQHRTVHAVDGVSLASTVPAEVIRRAAPSLRGQVRAAVARGRAAAML